MIKVAIVYHSGFGHTEKVAGFIQQGAAEIGAKVDLHKVLDIETNLDILDDADAIIFGAPTYMGSASAPMKSFMDASAGKWFEKVWKDKIAAGFTDSSGLSGDKLSTLTQFAVFAAQHGMIWVSSGLPSPVKIEGHGAKPEDINRIGSYLGLMTQSDNAAPENTPSAGDIESAKLFGRRIAEAALRWVRGKK